MFSLLVYLLVKKSILIITILGGIGFAIYRWKRHPRISLMTVLALGLYLFETFAFAILSYLLPSFFFRLHNIRTLDYVLQVLDDFVYAAVLILLVAAAFTGRVKESVTIGQRNDR